MTDRIARMRLRIREKATHRTWLLDWSPDSDVLLYCMTGTKRLVLHAPGYSEYNDRGEPVLDSWVEPTNFTMAHLSD